MFQLFKKKKTVGVHSGTFHTDDVFACAALSLAYGGNISIFRTRDRGRLQSMDIVVDVGGEYDPDRGRFDHHQAGGAGTRGNGIPYASFGLVWKKYGDMLAGSKEAAEKIDAGLVQPIDAIDNGVDIVTPRYDGIGLYSIHTVISSFIPTWKEREIDSDAQFEKAVALAIALLSREIKRTKDVLEGVAYVRECYERSADKRVILVEAPIGRAQIAAALLEFSEPLYAVYPDANGSEWNVVAIAKGFGTFDLRKPLPLAWAGLTGHDLNRATGVPESIFCHAKGFLIGSRTKSSALALAYLAANN